MASFEKYPMLAEGYEKLTTDLKRLRDERPLIVEAIEEARAHGFTLDDLRAWKSAAGPVRRGRRKTS